MLYVLYRNSGVHSGRILRRKLNELYSGTVLGGFPKRLELISRRQKKPEAIINLGAVDDINFDGLILNPQEIVRAASNKKQARVLFEKQGIPSPQLFLNPQQIQEQDLPVVGRISYHKKGQGFWFCRSLQEVNRARTQGATHFLQFIAPTREYRVHSFIRPEGLEKPREERQPEDYASIKISEKVWTGQDEPDLNTPQKNHQFGWSFLGQQNRRPEELDVVRHAAKRAAAALGVDFGAVDIMYNLRNKTPYVLEINSAPSLADHNSDTCERYAKKILQTLGLAKKDNLD